MTNNKAAAKEPNANEKFSGKALTESRLFAKDMWAATVALDPDAYYTVSEAQAKISAFLNRKVG